MMDDVLFRARSLVGCKFRPQGRDPEFGLDCVGVICAAFEIPTDSIPRDYRLRGREIERLKLEMNRFFRPVPVADTGDVLIFEIAEDQLHLGVATGRGFIHADAALRRVVETVGVAAWPLLSAHRRRRGRA